MKIGKEKLERIILGIIGGIIIIVILMTLVFGPKLKRIKELRIRIHEERNKVIEAEDVVSRLTSIRLNIKKLKGGLKQYQLNMPEATPDWLLGKLNALSSETGIDFDKIAPKGYLEQVGFYLLQGLYIELKADYHRLGGFINKLENLSPFIRILDLGITGNKDDVNRHIVKLTVGVYVSEEK